MRSQGRETKAENRASQGAEEPEQACRVPDDEPMAARLDTWDLASPAAAEPRSTSPTPGDKSSGHECMGQIIPKRGYSHDLYFRLFYNGATAAAAARRCSLSRRDEE